jgi:capsular polysaccharide biosynthesis protein
MQTDPTLAEILSSLWKAKTYCLLGLALGICVAAGIIMTATPLYQGTMIVAPADGYALGDYASSVAEGQSLDIPFWRPKDQEGVSTDYYRFIYTLKGPSVAAILLKDKTVLSGIAKDSSWKNLATDWTPEDLAAYLDRTIKIEHMGTTALRRITYNHSDPAFAAAFLRKLHLVSDQLIRRDRRRQSESRIAYLEEALQKATNPDHRKGIAQLLMQQENIRMLANLDEAYAAIIVEPAAHSARPVWPDKLLLFAICAVVGMMVGYMVRMMRHGS